MDSDQTSTLRALMHGVGISSFAQLCQQTGLPQSQVRRLRRGELQHLPMASVIKLGLVLQVPVSELWAQFAITEEEPMASMIQWQPSGGASPDQKEQALAPLKLEYERLQMQVQEQRQELLQAFQQSALSVLESLLLQWPTAAYAAQKNPQAPAVKLLPLLRPLEQLLHSWQVERIGTVGEEVTYDPRWHQVMASASGVSSEQVVVTGDAVRVRYVGYRQGDRLLYRAKVSLP